MLITSMVGCTKNQDSLIAGMKDALPAGWEMRVIGQKGAMETPHGLDEPVFRIDLVNHAVQFDDGAGRKIYPSLRLYFYEIAQRDTVLKAIENEKLYSWDIPDYFAETAEYIIVTSPLYINSGHFSEEAMGLFQPLQKALKDYFNLYK
jgi:hypothetical protein